jgi:AraC family transcriptional regulator
MKLMTEIIQYIEDNLSEELNVEAVATRSGYSVHHFQRMFATVTGLSMGSYIRRRRLTKAAHRLVDIDVRIIDLAIESGFESQEAFTRAFKSMFGLNPGEYRIRGLRPWMRAQNHMDEDFIQHLQTGGITMEPKFIDRSGFHVVGLGRVFKRQETSKIGQELWPEFIRRFDEIPNKKGKDGERFRTYGVCQEIFEHGLLQDEFRYLAAVEVSEDTPAPTGMELIYIPQQKYAVFTHANGLANLSKTTQFIWGSWLPKSGYKLAPASDLEVYSADFNPDDPNSSLEIWVPLENPPLK